MAVPQLKPQKEKRRNSPEDPEEFRATLAEHIDELRLRIFRSAFLLAGGWLVGWFLEPSLYEFLNEAARKAVVKVLPPGADYREVFANAPEAFMLKLKLAFFIGLVIVFPFLVMQLWGFVAPGLKPSERKPIQRLAPISLLLFLMGAGFCWLIIPAALTWFASYLQDFAGTSLYQHAGTLVFFVLKMMLAFGIGFQLPLVVYALGAVGLLSSETLFKYWRQSATIIFILSAILTPSNDAISMLMMAVPLVLLFMLSVYFVRITQRKKKAEEEEFYLDDVD